MSILNKKIIWPAMVVLFLVLAGCAENTSQTDEVAVETPVTAETVPEAAAPAGEAEETGVTFEGISFSYDPQLAGGVSPEAIPAAPEAENAPDWAIYPAHTQFTFNDYVLETPLNQPRLYVYPANQYRAKSEAAAEQIDRLQELLAGRPETFPERLPFLPLFNADQVIHSQVVYLEFENGSGVRFLTQYSQAVGPINNHELFYTFQGLTDEGAYYISAIFPVSHPSLPANASELPAEERSAFQDNFDAYRAATVEQLGQAQPDSFTPDLTRLDRLVQSILITADPEAQAAIGQRLAFSQVLSFSPTGENKPVEPAVRYRDLTVSLDDRSESRAQLTFPSQGPGPWPAVIFLSEARGTAGASSGLPPASFKLLAEVLSREGIAVLQVNRREAGGNDPASLISIDQSQQMADLETVIAAARLQPEINPFLLFLYGRGEEARVAVQVARRHPGLAGLILQDLPQAELEEVLPHHPLALQKPVLILLAAKETKAVSKVVNELTAEDIAQWIHEVVDQFSEMMLIDIM